MQNTLKLIRSALLLSVALALGQTTRAQTAPAAPAGPPELDGGGQNIGELYQAALKEGGTLNVYAGGDEINQQDATVQAFKGAFPNIKINLNVDLSKYQDGRIDQELASANLNVDLAFLQTLHDFDRWKAQGVLLPYKPAGWDHVPAKFKDADGAYTGLTIFSFSNVSNVSVVSPDQAPRDALDYLDPKWKGKIVLTYPNDDDAVLYQFYKIIQKYGWSFIDRLQAQDVHWVRGTATPFTLLLLQPGNVSFTTFAPLVVQPNLPLRYAVPRSDAFLSWAQTAAIFRDAKHPAAAKLFMSFLLSKQFQSYSPFWSIRDDLPAPHGYKPLSEYNTDHADFHAFLSDRAAMERFRTQIERYIGTPQGPSPLIDGI